MSDSEDTSTDFDQLFPDQNTPEEWKQKLINSHFQWELAQRVAMPKFLSKYTLHDSYWIGFWIGEHGEAAILLGWDVYWSRDRIPYSDEPGIPLPVLAIQFPMIFEISWYGAHTMLDNCISDAEAREGTEEEFLKAIHAFGTQMQPSKETIERLRTEGVYYTQFFPCLEGDPSTLRILHGGEVRLLCLNQLGELVRIPDLH